MVRIRLSRTGRKNLASYRIVVTNLREKRESDAIEILGYYLPHTKELQINEDRAKYWLSVGAQPSETVRSFLIKKNLLKPSKFKRTFSKKAGKKSTERKLKQTEAETKKEVKAEAREESTK